MDTSDHQDTDNSGTTTIEPVDEPTTTPPPVEAVSRPRRRRRRWVRWVLGVPLVLVVVALAAWGIDTWRHEDKVLRNTELAGTAVGGMTSAELAATIEDLQSELPGTPVTITTADGLTFETTAGALGLSIDADATAEATMDAGRDTNLLSRPLAWLQSFADPEAADVAVVVDTATLEEALTTIEGENRTAPVEPTLAAEEGTVVLVPGSDGIQLTAATVAESLPESLGDVGEEITVEVERTVTPPTLTDAQVQALVDKANGIVAATVEVTAGEQEFTITGAELPGAFSISTDASGPRLSLDQERVAVIVADQTPMVSANPTGVKFDIQGGVPVAVPGTDAQVCCGEGATDMIVDALLAGQPTVEVPTRTVTAAEGVEWANTLGVREVVGEFTTKHACCESRVTNIHRISDITRGVLIPPGTTWSVNDYVGRRTVEKGFALGGVIEDGEFKTDIGGGVSQYATTLFNAAFFGGLDIPTYKMHSKYISRYPYGREATLAYPGVDLEIRNDTPYGVVIWPTYTDTTITVQLWSTRHATGEQTAQSQSSGCGSVTTTRTRTWVDGRTDTDTFKANYDCD